MPFGDRRLEIALKLVEEQKQEYRLREVNHHIFIALHYLATQPQAEIDPDEISPKEILRLSDECGPFEFDVKLITGNGEAGPPDLFLSLKDGSVLCFEFKTTWHQDTVEQLVAYAAATHWQAKETKHRISGRYAVIAVIVDTSQTNVEQRIKELRAALAAQNCPVPVVILKAEIVEHPRRGDKWIMLRRIPTSNNMKCVPCAFGEVVNRGQEIMVSIKTLSRHMTRFHRTSDEVTAAWAAFLYWQHYLGNRDNPGLFSPAQRSAIQTRDKLPKDNPFKLTRRDASQLLPLGDVDRALTAEQQKKALQYLEEAGLVVKDKAKGEYHIPWCKPKKIRVPLIYKGHKELNPSERDSVLPMILNWAARQAEIRIRSEERRARKRLREIKKELATLDEQKAGGWLFNDIEERKKQLLAEKTSIISDFPDAEKRTRKTPPKNDG